MCNGFHGGRTALVLFPVLRNSSMNKKAQWNLGYIIVAALALLMIRAWWGRSRVTEVVPYSEFEHALADGRVDRVLTTLKSRSTFGAMKGSYWW